MEFTQLFPAVFRHNVTRACLLVLCLSGCQPASSQSSSEILKELYEFRQTGRVLYVAAHPDDENTSLITYFVHGRGFETAYLSLTRGDGGQNLIGEELGDELGLIRTHELLAARSVDGGRQFFGRAKDFGYSKSYREALSIWEEKEVLGDIVRTIRSFRPDVIVTRFSPDDTGTHGHHTASAVLAREAFRLAGDTNAFPEQLDTLEPWQPVRIFWNNFRGFSGASGGSSSEVRLNVGGYDPLSGASFGEIAARSRSMHKSQGFGSVPNRGSRYEYFYLLDGEPVSRDIFEGIDTTWSRIPGGAEIDRLAGEAIAQFDPDDPAASVPVLLEIRSRLVEIQDHPIVQDKLAHLDEIIKASLGLYVETTLPAAQVVPGESLRLQHTAIVRSSFPVRWLAVHYPEPGRKVEIAVDLKPNEPVTREETETLPENTPVSHPYWLREEGSPGMHSVSDPALRGKPTNPPPFPVSFEFEASGHRFFVKDTPVEIKRDPVAGEIRRDMEVIPPVSLNFSEDLILFTPGSEQSVTVEITSTRDDMNGILRLDAPAGWQVVPASHNFDLSQAGESAQFTFTITAPGQSTTSNLIASVEIDGQRYSNRRVEIHYDHLPPLVMQPSARLTAVSLELAIRGSTVGYLPGAGDLVGESLKRMGYTVTRLTSADLNVNRLQAFDAVVVGVRAFNTRDDLGLYLPALFEYVEDGGNLIVQYNTSRGLVTNRLAPFDLNLSSNRVTDENAEVTFLAPDHPVLNTPNRITQEDFEHWVQERGLYFPGSWDERFTPILASHDPGEAPLEGGLLVAPYGEGYFVYTGYSFFRQLPRGVPGAYRLFANLVSLGK